MIKRFLYILFAAVIFAACDDSPLSPDLSGSNVPVLDISMTIDDYTRLRSEKLTNMDVPVKVIYKGTEYTGDIRSSGAGSRYHGRWGYKVDLNDDGPAIEGMYEFNLSSQVYDPTLMRTFLAEKLYREAGLTVSFTRPVLVKINGRVEGLYPMIERVDENFFLRRHMEFFEVYKAGFGAEMSFENGNHPKFHYDKEMPDDDNYYTLYELIHAVDTSSPGNIRQTLGKHLDIDNYLWYHSMTSVINNFDALTNNYIIFTSQPGKPFKIIPWDFDNAFTHKGGESVAGNNDIVEKLFKNTEIRETYVRFTQYILMNLFTEDNLYPAIDSLAAGIEEPYNLDPWLGGEGRYDFYTEINKLKNYITERRNYLITELNNFDKKE